MGHGHANYQCQYKESANNRLRFPKTVIPPTRVLNEMQTFMYDSLSHSTTIAPFGDAYEKIGTIQRRLAWPLHKDDTLFQSGRPTGLNIYFIYILTTVGVSVFKVYAPCFEFLVPYFKCDRMHQL